MASRNSVTLRANLGGCEVRARQLIDRGQYALVNQVYADANMYAPMLSGQMRIESQVSADNKSITWNAPYARRQYYNQFSNYTTPGTGPKWDQKAAAIHMQSWISIVEGAMH